MRRVFLIIVIPLLIACQKRTNDVRIGVPPCLQEAFEEIISQYKTRSKTRIVASYINAATFAKQVENGLKSDIFISGNIDWMDYLKRKEVLSNSNIRHFISDKLVIIKHSGSNLKIDVPEDILKAKKIAMADFSYAPMGMYGKKYLENIKLWNRVFDKIVCTLHDVAAVATVASGACSAGVVAYSDAINSKNVEICYEIDKNVPKIDFRIALLKNNNKEVLEFYQFINSKEAKSVFEKYGFKNESKE